MELPKSPKIAVRNHGFTLIELMVVMAILAILATLGFASFQRAQRNARDAVREKDLNQVKTALEQYFDLNGVYPISGVGGVINCGANQDWGDPWICGGTTYMKVLPKDPSPATNPQYCYYAPGTLTTYEIYAQMENDNHGNRPGGLDGPGQGSNCPGPYDFELKPDL